MNKPVFNIEAWSDYRCPFCYIADVLIRKMVADMSDEAGIIVTHKAYELYPDAPRHTENTILDNYSRKYAISRSEAEEKIAAISEYGRRVGINNFNYGGAVPTNSFDAHRLTKYAAEKGHPEIFYKLMEAYFCDNVNIADIDILCDIAAEVGLDRAEVKEMLRSDRYAQAVIDDEKQAVSLGIRSVPCFLINKEDLFVGTGCMAQMRAYIRDRI